MQFNEKLKLTRKSVHMTQRHVAELLGISERAYQHYEMGTREPNIEMLLRLSILLNVSLDDLLCRADYKKSHEVPSGEF